MNKTIRNFVLALSLFNIGAATLHAEQMGTNPAPQPLSPADKNTLQGIVTGVAGVLNWLF